MKDRDQQPESSLIDQLAAALRLQLRTAFHWRWRIGELHLAVIVLAMTPVMTMVAGIVLSLKLDRSNRDLAIALAPRIAALDAAHSAIALRDTAAPLFTLPTISHLLTRMSEKLPPNAHVRMLSIDRDGGIVTQIDCNDPDALLSALRSDSEFGSLRMVGQAPAEQGVRVTLRQPGR